MIHNTFISVTIGVAAEVALLIAYLTKASIFEGAIQKVLIIFNISGHFDNFINGILDIQGIIYFLSVVIVCIFLTVQSIAKRRWN